MLPFGSQSLTDGWPFLDRVTMSTQKAKSIPDVEWQAHKQVLEHLWLKENKKLVGPESVKETMESSYNFFAS